MARLSVLEYPDERLRIVAQRVTAFTPELEQLGEDMFETMHATRAIGLAATQVNVHQRIVAVDVSGGAGAPELFINPEVVWSRDPGIVEERCLSLPGIVGNVLRATRLQVRAVDRSLQPYLRELEGVPAVCMLHEIDHLDGKLFIDRLPFFTRLGLRRKFRKLRAVAR